ncbi:phage portal protein [Streptosporangium sp. NPDC001559]|uniref:phage portal protein n=1 Tax=Streptosporangium sp. NPDC001559 TaxID=3366187 RepID=UPI0036E9BA12
MSVLERIANARGRPAARSITTIDEYALAVSQFMYGGALYGGGVQQTIAGQAERITVDLAGLASAAYAAHGPVFALMAVRMRVFSSVRLVWQQVRGGNGRPGKFFGNSDLSLLETPWVGGTTQDLLTAMIVDLDLTGNSYFTRVGGELVRLRPDWVSIVLEPRQFRGGTLGYRRIGYLYQEGGLGYGDGGGIPLLPDEVCHFTMEPDPLATYRGMSWLTPVLRELQNDKLMQVHQRKFFENGATPNMVISLDAAVKPDMMERFVAKFRERHEGVENAYRTLMVGGGADVTVVGANFDQMAFTGVQGRGETRLAAAAGVPVTIVGFSEGLQGSSLNAGNFGQARRQFADGTMHALWSSAAGSLQQIVSPPPGARLWFDTRNVPFLREDAKDAAEIQQIRAATIRTLGDAGYTSDSVKAAVEADDMSLLEHSGLYSVQLQPPGTSTAPAIGAGDEGGTG